MTRNLSYTFLNEVFPISDIVGNTLVSSLGDLTRGWKVEFSDIDQKINQEHPFILSLENAIRALPPHYIIHRQDIFTQEEYTYPEDEGYSYLKNRYEAHFCEREYLKKTTYIFLTQSCHDNIYRGIHENGLFSSFRKAKTPGDNIVNLFTRTADAFQNTISNTFGVRVTPVTESDWLESENSFGILRSYMTLFSGSGNFSDIYLDKDQIRIEDKQAVVVSVRDSVSDDTFGDNIIHRGHVLGSGAPVGMMLDFPHIVNTYIITTERAKELDHQKKRMEKAYALSSDIHNRMTADKIKELINDAYQDKGLTFILGHCDIIAWGDSEDIPSICSRIESTLSNNGFIPNTEKVLAPVLWYCGIPGASANISIWNLKRMELSQILHLHCNEDYDRGIDGGCIELCDTLRNIPLKLDFKKAAYDKGMIDNYNAFVLGPSGSGKSFLMNHLCQSLYDNGEDITIIDIGNSYQGLCSIIHTQDHKDGILHSLGNEGKIQFCPFRNISKWVIDGVFHTESPGVNAFLSILIKIWKQEENITSFEMDVLTDIVEKFAKKAITGEVEPSMDGLYQFICDTIKQNIKNDSYFVNGSLINVQKFDIDSFELSLLPYCKGGRYEYLFNAEDKKEESRFTVYELGEIASNKILFPIVVLAIICEFDQKMLSRDGFKTIVIEEAWKAISTPSTAPLLTNIWKTSRKYNSSAIVVSQQASDLESSTFLRDTIIANSSTKMLLNSRQTIDSVRKNLLSLGIDQRYSENICSDDLGNRRTVFIHQCNVGGKIYSFEACPEQRIAFESNIQKKKEFLQKSKELGSPILAIHSILTDHENQNTSNHPSYDNIAL